MEMGASLKYLSLGILIVQTTSLVLVLRYSRTANAHPDGVHYLSSTAVVVVEICKVLACCFVVLCQKGFVLADCASTFSFEILKKPWDTMKMVVPSGLYVIQNNLLYIALTNLDAATYQVTYQLKILTTAMFSVAILKKRLGLFQCISLIFLVLGVSLVQMPSGSQTTNISWNLDSTPQLVGLLTVIAACFSSGFAGVYFEKILKGSLQSLWIRNIQLGIFGTVFGIFGVIINDLSFVKSKGFFQGYNHITWIVIALQAFGGILVAVVIKYADNILKSFAASLSIILSVIFSYFISGDMATSQYFMLGTAIVLCSTLLYTFHPPSLPIHGSSLSISKTGNHNSLKTIVQGKLRQLQTCPDTTRVKCNFHPIVPVNKLVRNERKTKVSNLEDS